MNTNNSENYPSIFAEGPSPLVSNKYQFIKTSDVLESLSSLGWNPREMSEVRARKPHTKGFQKHLIRLSNPEFKTVNVGDEVPELVLTNSHNGKNSFSFRSRVMVSAVYVCSLNACAPALAAASTISNARSKDWL